MLHPLHWVFDLWIFHLNRTNFIQQLIKRFTPVFFGLFLAGRQRFDFVFDGGRDLFDQLQTFFWR